MTVTIYHNPRCSKSRQTLAILQDRGLDPVIIDYLKTPPGVPEITEILQKLNIPPRGLIRTKEAKETGLDALELSTSALIAKIAANPIVIERPIVMTPKGARICRPPERVEEIL